MNEQSPPDPPAPVSADENETEFDQPSPDSKTFPCPGCGADIVFEIGLQQLECPYCGYTRELTIDEDAEIIEQDYLDMLARLRDRDQLVKTSTELQELKCHACAGTIVFQGTLTSKDCPYCGTPTQIKDAHRLEHRIAVQAVLPFRVDHDRAGAQLKKWVKSQWFAPNSFKKHAFKNDFNGVYLPFWTFDTMTANRYRGQRGENYTATVGTGKNRRTVTRTRWYPASGAFQRFFDDVLVLGARGFAAHLIHNLEPWPLNDCIPFTEEALAGFAARTYDLELEEGFELAQTQIKHKLREDVRRRIGGDKQRISSIDTKYHAITFKHLLLPMWLMSYRFQEKVYHVTINAVTGEVQGDRPYSWWKITLAVLAVLIVIGGIFFLTQR